MQIPVPELIDAGSIHYPPATAQAVDDIVMATSGELITINQTFDEATRRAHLTTLFGRPLAEDTVIRPPFLTDFGKHTKIGRHVFINRDCFFVDLGGITIDDDVLLGPRTMVISVGHNEDPARRRDLVLHAVHIEHGAWLGANVTVLPGVTIGANAIVGAGAVVTKDVPANTVAVGVPAKVLRPLKRQAAAKGGNGDGKN